METDELIKKCSAITLEEEEEDKVIFGDRMKAKGTKIVAGCLVGKLLTARSISYEGVKIALQQAWRPMGVVKVESLRSKIFMFKFSSEEDKRRVLVGGPWHFDRALIVLEEPSGIGNVTEQPFSHVSFWVQLHNVPLMCIDTTIIREIGAKIGKVEDVATDETGDCFGEYVRVRISIDITKRFKKIIKIQREDERETLIGVIYEKLPDYCFCCGFIGHQYRECAQYKGQPKEEMAYGAWLKAAPLTDRWRFQRNKEKKSREQRRPSKEVVESENTNTLHPQHTDPKRGNGAGSTQYRAETSSLQIGLKYVAEAPEGTVTLQGQKLGRCQIDNVNQADAAENREDSKSWCQRAGTQKEKESLEGKLSNKLSVMDPTTKQPNDTAQKSSDEKVVNAESCLKKAKAKWKRWKNQARISNKKSNSQIEPSHTKRTSCDTKMMSPQSKRTKLASPRQSVSIRASESSPLAKIKLSWDTTAIEMREMLDLAVNEIPAEAGFQPRQKQ